MAEYGYSFAGLFVGFLVGLTGVGGGSLMAPLLILMFGFSPATAVGTDLWFAAITKSVGGVIHRRVGSPDWQIIKRLVLGSLPAATLTLVWLHFFEDGKLDPGILLPILGAALVVSAILTPFKSQLHGPLVRLRDRIGPGIRRHQIIATVLGGGFVGMLVTLTSVGAGALVAVLLMLLYPMRLKANSLVSTDILHAIPLALVAAIGHSWLGNVDWSLLVMLLIGSIPGIVAGSLLANKINEGLVRNCLAVMLLLSGLKMLFG